MVDIETLENKKIETYETFSFFRRCVDILGGIVGCLITLVACIFIKISYLKSGDKHKIIYTQERIGKNGKTIVIYKFRSMVPNADELLNKLLEEDEELAKEYKTYKKLENDPRITKCGHFIRKYSIDELPQFFNVLKGDMSLVGPRPYLLREKDDMKDAYSFIIQCKPGITGPWQIGGRSDVTFDDRLQIDVNYIKQYQYINDIKILFKTVEHVLKGVGAK